VTSSLTPPVPVTRRHTHAAMVIVCDDDYDDWLLTEDAWSTLAPTIELRHANDGQVLLDLLYTLATEDDTFPALILLDLYMPALDGWDTLAAVKANDESSHIPIVIFTTASVHGQVSTAFARGAAGCITKPSSYNALLAVTESLHTYWFTTNPVIHR
jgi:CheY-like chemotaxis protein